MSDIQETQLPGVGNRYDFVTSEGERIGVLVHRSGRRELLVYDRDDPDACRAVIRLDTDDTRTLAELLGASHVSERLAAMQQIAGLAIDWVTIPPASSAVGRTLRDAALRTETGVRSWQFCTATRRWRHPDPISRSSLATLPWSWVHQRE